jgi:hypothetical protein
VSPACSAPGRPAGAGLGAPTQPGWPALGGRLPAARRQPRVLVLARCPSGWWPPPRWPSNRQAPIARAIIDRDRTLVAALDAQIAEADKRLATLLPRKPPSPCCAAALAGGWSGPPPTAPRSVTRHDGPAPASCIGPADCAQRLHLGWPPPRRRHQPRRLGDHTAGRALARVGCGRLDPAARAYAALLRARGKLPGELW